MKNTALPKSQTGYSPQIQRVIATCRLVYEQMPEELRVIGLRTSVLAPLPAVGLGQSPCYAAAWVIWVIKQTDPPLEGDEGPPRILRPFVFVGPDEWPPHHLGNMNVRDAEELTNTAKEVLVGFKMPDPAEFFATGWEGWLSDSEGKPSLVGRWGLLLATLANLRYPLSKLPEVGGPYGCSDADPDISGIHWWESIEEILRLRWVIDRVREVLHLADGIDADATPTEKRWHPRAERLLRDIDSQFGSSLDIPAIGGRPRVVGRRLAPLRHGFVAHMDQLIERVQEMGIPIEVYRGKLPPRSRSATLEAKPGEYWQDMNWIELAVEEYGKDDLKFPSWKLTRLAKESSGATWFTQERKNAPRMFDVEAVSHMRAFSDYSGPLQDAIAENFVPPSRRAGNTKK